MIRYPGLLLDIDDTLYRYAPAHERAFQAMVDVLATRLYKDEALIRTALEEGRHQTHRRLHGTGSSHNRLLYVQRALELLETSPTQHATLAHNTYWDVFLEHIQLREGVAEFLANVRPSRICFVTDLTADIQHRKILKLDLVDYADCLVTSEEAGHEKPHPYIFELALDKLGLRCDQVCMIGDNWDKDIVGALQLGIPAFYFHEPEAECSTRENPENVTTFTSFRQLNQLLSPSGSQ
jgi:HAD superfamily hydrolase (TIGR01549 family)